MDITDALAPKSDQLDAVELVAPRTFTIDEGSRLGNRDGFAVVEVRLVDFPRVWRPSKGMLDAIVAVWGTNAKEWAGQSVTLYNDPEVTYGRDKVGGVRISHMTGIDKTRTVMIRGRGQGGKKIPWRIEPLVAPTKPKPATITDEQAADLIALMDRKGSPADKRVAFAAWAIKQPIADLSELTVDQWQTVAGELEKKPDVDADPFAQAEAGA